MAITTLPHPEDTLFVHHATPARESFSTRPREETRKTVLDMERRVVEQIFEEEMT